MRSPETWQPSAWAEERAELIDPSLLEPALARFADVFSPNWAAGFGAPDEPSEVGLPSRLHPAMADVCFRGSRWKLLLGGAALHLLETNEKRVIADLRREPCREQNGQRTNKYEDTLAELMSGLLARQLGFEVSPEPSPPPGRKVRKKPDWLARLGSHHVLFESKRRKASDHTVARRRAQSAFIEGFCPLAPSAGIRWKIRLTEEFDRATRTRGAASEQDARELGRRAAAFLPAIDGTFHPVITGVHVAGVAFAPSGFEISPPPIDYDHEFHGFKQSIDTAWGQMKPYDLPSVVVLASDDGPLAVHHYRSLAEHVAMEHRERLAAVLLVLDDAPHVRLQVFAGPAFPEFAPVLGPALDRCDCGAWHLDILTHAEECAWAEMARCQPPTAAA